MNAIKKNRELLNFTQEGLAAEVGVTQGAVSSWEKGLTFPSTKKLPKVAKALKCSIEDLLNDTIS